MVVLSPWLLNNLCRTWTFWQHDKTVVPVKPVICWAEATDVVFRFVQHEEANQLGYLGTVETTHSNIKVTFLLGPGLIIYRTVLISCRFWSCSSYPRWYHKILWQNQWLCQGGFPIYLGSTLRYHTVWSALPSPCWSHTTPGPRWFPSTGLGWCLPLR